MDERYTGVLTEIRSLLDEPAAVGAHSRAEVEYTLTSGYAYALGIEGEKLRVERRLRSLLRAGGHEGEVTELTGKLAEVDRELAGLRGLLSSLRAQLRPAR